MAPPDRARRLIVNADDFGRSDSINAAVIRAHQEGILTTTSLMVNEPATAAALELARQNPRLGVGLHLALSHGRSALPPESIPKLVNERGEFSNHAAYSGLRYFARPCVRKQLRREIRAQFEKFRATGLPLDHVNGHLHFHLHPTIFRMVLELVEEFGVRQMRLTREPFWLDAPLASGQRFYRASHAAIYFCLSAYARPKLRRRNIRHTQRVFGLLQNARVNEAYLLKLLPILPPGDSELYSHPSLDEFKLELDALLSPRVNAACRERGIQLIRYQDL